MAGRGRGRTVPAWMQKGGDGDSSTMSLPTAAPSAPNPSREPVRGMDGDGLAPGWAEAVAHDGRKYWYNITTQVTRWDKPVAGLPQPVSAVPQSQAASVADAGVPNSEPPQQTIPEWKEATAGDGRVYYYHAQTGETRWEKPETEAPVSSLPITPVPSTTAAAKPAVTVPVEVPPQKAPDSDLLEGWLEYKTPEGRVYYHNPSTRETRWERPSKSGSEKAPLQKAPQKHRVAEKPAAEWKEYETPDGKKYYHNPQTNETKWTNPALDDEKSSSKPSDRGRKTDDRKGSRRRGGVTRPRDAKGRPLNDKAAELHFITENEKKRARKADVMESIDLSSMTDIEKTKLFKSVLEELGVTHESRWLETMKICSADPRYFVLSSYGRRHNAFAIYLSQATKRAKVKRILETRRSYDEFFEVLEEHLKNENNKARSLEDCSSATVRMVEEDPRYKAVSDHHERRSMIRSFFIDRERRMRDVHRAKRRENMGALRAVLDKHSSGETPTFHERTSFRQVCDVLAKDPAFLALDEPDRSVVYDEWQNEQRAKVMEARAKEKERKRAQERAKRGAFREKLEELIMSGEIELTARYKDVLPILKEKKWFASTVDQETKTSDLYRDVIDAIEEKLARHKDKFRSILKDAGLSVELGTTFLSIWEKTQPALEENKISKFYAEALFSRQQEKLTVAKKKEEKRVQRIKEDYWDLLRRKEVNEKSSWHEIKVGLISRVLKPTEGTLCINRCAVFSPDLLFRSLYPVGQRTRISLHLEERNYQKSLSTSTSLIGARKKNVGGRDIGSQKGTNRR
mmetsp:Transcript_32277/g.126318  ORF Transcript_32277/g.126318 Transcript_32277/m.126318 type:complete len:798 (-) Transcript_32277:4355-6748(-)